MTFGPAGLPLSRGSGRVHPIIRHDQGKGGRHVTATTWYGGRSAFVARAVLAALLVPFLLFANPLHASAAARFGPAASASLQESWGPTGTGSWADCSLSAYWMLDGSVMSVKGSIQCSTGFAVASLTIPDLTFSGPACTVSGGIGAELDGIESPTSFFAGPATTSDCMVDQVCADFSYRTHGSMPWSDSASASACSPISVGGPEFVSTDRDCATLRYAMPKAVGPVQVHYYGGYYYAKRQLWSWSVTNNGASPVTVGAYAYVSANFGNRREAAHVIGTTDAFGNRTAYQGTFTVPAGETVVHQVYVQVSDAVMGTSPPALSEVPVLGAGYASGSSFATGWHHTPGATAAVHAVGGTTQSPSPCTAYWGTQIEVNSPSPVQTPISALDAGAPEPGSDTEPSPSPTAPVADDSCDFSFTDPTSWAGAGICQLVGLFQALIDAVGGIAGAILGGLADLFVPDSDVLAAEVDSVRDAWQDSTVGNYLQPFADADFSVPDGGCAGPTVDFSIRGKDVNWQPLNACSGAVATLANLAKLFVTVFVGFFGGLACVRAVGGGFGWRPGVAE